MVTLYVKNNCHPCKITAKILDEKGITPRVKNLETDPTAIAEVKELGYLQAPVVVTETDHWSGLNPNKLAAL